MAEQPAVATSIAAPNNTPDLCSPAPRTGAALESVVAIRSEPVELGGYGEGLVAGLVGALTIALWFLIVDVIDGRPLYTPNVLGAALFGSGAGLDNLDALPISLDLVLPFTWLHLLVFLLIGWAASRLLALAEREPSFGFGILLTFVVFEFGFIMVNMVFAEPLLHALDWSEVLTGNLLAAGAMAVVFRRRHPHLTLLP